MTDFSLADLEKIVAARARGADPSASYTARLLHDGVQRCAKKFGEEAVEAALAAVGGNRRELVAETADVLYHLIVMLKAGGVKLSTVMTELERRTVESGLAEKARRAKKR